MTLRRAVVRAVVAASSRRLLPPAVASGLLWRIGRDALDGLAPTLDVRLLGAPLRLTLPLRHRPNLTIAFGRLAASEDGPAVAELVALALDAKLVWDVGANAGLFALAAAVASPRATVVAFEPNPELAAMLRGHAAANPQRLGNLVVEEAALSATSGVARLLLPSDNRMGSLEPSFLDVRGATPRIATTVRTLAADEYAAAHGYPDVIKVDVEGHELAFLRGATEVIARRPSLVIEIADENVGDPLIRGLFELGYRPRPVGSHRVLAGHAALAAFEHEQSFGLGTYVFSVGTRARFTARRRE